MKNHFVNLVKACDDNMISTSTSCFFIKSNIQTELLLPHAIFLVVTYVLFINNHCY